MENATSDTLQKVASEFEGEVLMELQEGRSQSVALIEASKKGTMEAVAKILETSVKQAEALKRQIVGAAELEARNTQLKALEEAVTEVFSSAVSQVSKMSGPRYDKSLTDLVGEGIEAIGPHAKVSCNSRDGKLVAVMLNRIKGDHVKLAVDDQSVDTIGGVVLTTMDGSVRFDNTFEARLERLRPALRKEVAGVLGGRD
ncbi:MAG: hypothetical protein LYZ66_03845 [Nitrososphaerales archaeon]|nr:hypothetical protein [Nitrososphaerales archaeon]